VIAVENAPRVAVSVGNAFAEGTRLQLAECQSPSGYGVIHLQTLHVLATSAVDRTAIHVEQALPPINLIEDAPVLNTCAEDGPIVLDCTVSTFYLNDWQPNCGADCWPGPCSPCGLVAAQPTTWESVKQLYRQ
jgi:hypothetical protein